MKRMIYIGILLFTACGGETERQGLILAKDGSSIPATVEDIPLPEGYVRSASPPNSFPDWLRKRKLKKDATVFLYNGAKKSNQTAQYAVLDIDIGPKDLQQCADAVMRLRAEYLFSQKKFDSIFFNFNNGFRCDYSHYASGYRVRIKGNNCSWIKSASANMSYAAFREYMNLVFSYAGTSSLYKQMKPVEIGKLRPGMVFIQQGNPYGHAVTVMDMAVNSELKDTIFLLSQSYMPAQDMHILVNPANENLSPWYSTKIPGGVLQTPEWTFNSQDLKTY